MTISDRPPAKHIRIRMTRQGNSALYAIKPNGSAFTEYELRRIKHAFHEVLVSNRCNPIVTIAEKQSFATGDEKHATIRIQFKPIRGKEWSDSFLALSERMLTAFADNYLRITYTHWRNMQAATRN